MTRSIFDPTGPETERSGSRNLGPDAIQGSQMPPDITDGVVSEEERADYQAAGLEPPTPNDTIDMGPAQTAPLTLVEGPVSDIDGSSPTDRARLRGDRAKTPLNAPDLH